MVAELSDAHIAHVAFNVSPACRYISPGCCAHLLAGGGGEGCPVNAHDAQRARRGAVLHLGDRCHDMCAGEWRRRLRSGQRGSRLDRAPGGRIAAVDAGSGGRVAGSRVERRCPADTDRGQGFGVLGGDRIRQPSGSAPTRSKARRAEPSGRASAASSRRSAPGSDSPLRRASASAPPNSRLIVRMSRTGLFNPISVVLSSASAGKPLVGRLRGDRERLGDLGPGPSLVDRPRHGGPFEAVGEPAQRHYRRERRGRVFGARDHRIARRHPPPSTGAPFRQLWLMEQRS